MKSKKLLLGSLSTMALVATPIATVVSCGKKNSAAAVAKVTKTKAEGFVLTVDSTDYYITPELASKAGSIKIGEKTYKWDAAMKADTKVTDATVAAASKDGFAVPNKDGILEYSADLAAFKNKMEEFFEIFQGETKHSTIVIKPTKLKANSDAELSADSITAINDFISASGWKVKSATIAVGLNADKDAVYNAGGHMQIAWEEITKTPAKTGTGTDQAAKDKAAAAKKVAADMADAAIVQVALGQLTGTVTSATAVAAVSTPGTTAITNKAGLAAAIKATTGNTSVVVTISAELPTDLKGTTVTIKSIEAIAAAGGATGDVVLSIKKGLATVEARITITGHA